MVRTATPPPASASAVPPVETTSTPSSVSPAAKSTIPRLSETDSSARLMRTAPGSVSVPVDECSAMPRSIGEARVSELLPAGTQGAMRPSRDRR